MDLPGPCADKPWHGFPSLWSHPLPHVPVLTDRESVDCTPAHQDFREPLYLLDKPVWVEDTRSEEERKYPELFRHKLRGKQGEGRGGW